MNSVLQHLFYVFRGCLWGAICLLWKDQYLLQTFWNVFS
jgi:hypothetical protein